jgi:hypothetical protein
VSPKQPRVFHTVIWKFAKKKKKKKKKNWLSEPVVRSDPPPAGRRLQRRVAKCRMEDRALARSGRDSSFEARDPVHLRARAVARLPQAVARPRRRAVHRYCTLFFFFFFFDAAAGLGGAGLRRCGPRTGGDPGRDRGARVHDQRDGRGDPGRLVDRAYAAPRRCTTWCSTTT